MITINVDTLVSVIITAVFTLIGIILTHHFTKKRKIDELLFNARKEAYTEFIKNFGMAFHTETLDIETDERKAVQINYERTQRASKIFAQCRLVANPMLEDKLRHLYDLVIGDLENGSIHKGTGRRERDYIGYEVEALMRRDLTVISSMEVMLWRLLSVTKRYQLRKEELKNKEDFTVVSGR